MSPRNLRGPLEHVGANGQPVTHWAESPTQPARVHLEAVLIKGSLKISDAVGSNHVYVSRSGQTTQVGIKDGDSNTYVYRPNQPVQVINNPNPQLH